VRDESDVLPQLLTLGDGAVCITVVPRSSGFPSSKTRSSPTLPPAPPRSLADLPEAVFWEIYNLLDDDDSRKAARLACKALHSGMARCIDSVTVEAGSHSSAQLSSMAEAFPCLTMLNLKHASKSANSESDVDAGSTVAAAVSAGSGHPTLSSTLDALSGRHPSLHFLCVEGSLRRGACAALARFASMTPRLSSLLLPNVDLTSEAVQRTLARLLSATPELREIDLGSHACDATLHPCVLRAVGQLKNLTTVHWLNAKEAERSVEGVQDILGGELVGALLLTS